jgi:hypothetical protein
MLTAAETIARRRQIDAVPSPARHHLVPSRPKASREVAALLPGRVRETLAAFGLATRNPRLAPFR